MRTNRGDDLGEEETETPSYLQEGPSQLPDFIDEVPQATPEHEQVSGHMCVQARQHVQITDKDRFSRHATQHEALRAA